jgi:16S rRNA (guanine966-N2)-methyltransferase
MRIVAGRFRSRRLRAVGRLDLRPTSDRLRETLFNILGARVEGATFVDLYAGTGAVGIEALSRGSAQVIFVEKRRAAAQLIRENLRALGVGAAAGGGTAERGPTSRVGENAGVTEVLCAPVLPTIPRLAARGLQAELVFCDPPYLEVSGLPEVIEAITGSSLLASGGMVMAEHASRDSLPEKIGALRRTRVLRQGDSAITFWGTAAGSRD